jgi:hypothetical protein
LRSSCDSLSELPYAANFKIAAGEQTLWKEECKIQDELIHKYFTVFEYYEDYGIGLVRIVRPLDVFPKDFYIPNRGFIAREEREKRISERQFFAMEPIDISHLLTKIEGSQY